jgi:hypothetical protein
MKKTIFVFIVFVVIVVGCATIPPPQWYPVTDSAEAEYTHYLTEGTATLMGQAFLTQQGGGVVKAAGRMVKLDPATSIGNEWWGKAGKVWVHRSLTPPSVNFHKARRTTIADADGKFTFYDLPSGKYYVRTEVTWEIGGYYPQGGIVGQVIEIQNGQTKEVILNQYPQ